VVGPGLISERGIGVRVDHLSRRDSRPSGK
jgi:hypothetical protein